ncbi:DUF4913 domain-containing protein [Streptomyces tauricus]|uniref:DUF4913 domain-containing protein n=1 Tax=Streptomyces tauricus TaxID=68274 RepID=UPI00224384EF|nr:DUF4913 domain-containing protein [Streptomyces tauricus]MCW8103318.1 DUF4913 domain-containing protein [Streptomyces tauricus]
MREHTYELTSTYGEFPSETSDFSAPGWMDDSATTALVNDLAHRPGEIWDSAEKADPQSLLPADAEPPARLGPAEPPPMDMADSAEVVAVETVPAEAVPAEAENDDPPFILYKEGESFNAALDNLILWVSHLLLPVYGREISSQSPWCPRWWMHMEAVAQLYGLWMAWQELTGSTAPLTGPASWHRDHLAPVMMMLRNPTGPFAGCTTESHRVKELPQVDAL